MRKSPVLLAALLLALAHAASAQQNANLEQGLKPFGSYQGGNIDSVSLTNGNLSLHGPLVSYPQRGGKLSLGFFFRYNNKGWQIQEFVSGGVTTRRWIWQGSGVDVVRDQELRIKDTTLQVTDTVSGSRVYVHLFDAINSDGASHQLETPSNATNTSQAVDASGISMRAIINGSQITRYLIDKAGIQYTPNASGPNYAATVEDPNGNLITANSGGWTDTLGRSIPGSISDTSYGNNNNSQLIPGVATTDVSQCPSGTARARNWYIPGPSSGTSLIKLCYASVSLQSQFGLSGVQEGTATDVFLNAIVLPNGTSWRFSYNSWGDLTQIAFPTGGTLSYAWTSSVFCLGTSRAVSTRTLDANDGTGAHTWTYNWPGPRVTDPAGNDTVYTVAGVGGSCSLYVTQEKYFQGAYTSNNLLKTVTTAYSGIQSPRSTTYGLDDTGINVVAASVTTTWTNGKTTQQTTAYDSGYTFTFYDATSETTSTYPLIYGSVLQSTDSDYGANSQPGAVIKQTATTYQWQSDSNYLTANMLGLVTTSKILDGTGNKCAETDYTYDNPSYLTASSITMQHVAAPGPKRGNVSSITQQLTATPCSPTASWRSITSYVNAYDTGTTYQSTDPLSHTTTYTYSPTFYGAYLTQMQSNSTTTPGVAGSVTHISSANYDFNTGFKSSATDENGNVTSFQYDNSFRLTQSSFPDSGLLTFSYQDAAPFGVTVTRKITSTQNQVTTAKVDGVGRLSQTQFVDPNCTVGSGLVKTDFVYTEDAVAHDRLTKTSTPYCDTPGVIYGLMTVNHSDPLGRTKSVVQTDGSTLTTTYSDNLTTVTDEAGKSRKSQTDGLGRLTAVWEDPAGLNYETDYQYDTLGNLLRIDQKGGDTNSANWRTRTFSYDSLSRLLTASNPESGTITYSYNDDGTLASKTAPKPNQSSPSVTVTTNFTYDEIHRLTSKTYTDGTTPTVKYIYDGVSLATCTPSGFTDSNPKPNRTSMCDAAGASAWSHDVMGRILSDQRTTNSVTKTTTYSYNLDGSLATLTYPSGRVITYSYNNAARPVSAVDSTGPINYATAATYAPQGVLASFQNGGSIVSTMYFNSRLQPCRISVKNTGTAPGSCTDAAIGNVLDFTYNFSVGTADNGNVTGITNNRDTTRSQSFTYDPLNRIATAKTSSTSGTNCWDEQFGYDPWANLLTIGRITGYSCSNEELLNVSATTANQITGDTYDAAGNLITIPSIANYTYNAENQLTATSGVTYTYDGDGKRVQKSNGKLYWYGMGSDPLDETDLAGNTNNASFNEYIFFNGKRIARRDSTNAVNYYFADHLGTARIVADFSGNALDDSDFYPFGGERVYLNSSPQNYKFTGKERDSESGLDDFGARYFGSTMGRFMSPDPPLLDQHIVDPQSWNLYSYARNNPLSYIDPTGNSVELLGDEEQRKKELAFLQKSLGNDKAASNLYINEVKDGDKTRYFVGIKGDVGDFMKMGATSHDLANLVQNKNVVEFGLTSKDLSNQGGAATYEKGEIGNQNVRVLVNPAQADVANRVLDENTVLGASRFAGQNQNPRWRVNPFTGEVMAWHEFGHAWASINGRSLDRSNPEAFQWENRMREQLYGPLGPNNARRIAH